jgi:hypothetical protein
MHVVKFSEVHSVRLYVKTTCYRAVGLALFNRPDGVNISSPTLISNMKNDTEIVSETL